MNLIKQVIEQINLSNTDQVAYNQRQIFMNQSSVGKVHVLFLSPYDNGTGLYRCIVPAMELNKLSTHAAVVNQVEPFSLEKQTNGFEVHLNTEIMHWADYVVFGTSFHDLQGDIDLFRKDNPKPVKFVMDVDDNYLIPDPQQNAQSSNKLREQLIKNMAACDIVTCSTATLLKVYSEKVQNYVNANKNVVCNTKFLILPNLMSNDCYLEMDKQAVRPSEKIRIGMIFNPTQFKDVNPFRKILLEVNRKYKNVELIVFGWNGKLPKQSKDTLQNVQFTYVKPVPIGDYFQTLWDQHFDFCLMPLQDNEFNKGKTHHKLLQYSQLGIPAICSDVEPYNQIIAEDIEEDGSTSDTYFLPHLKASTQQEWLDCIDLLIKNPAKRKAMGQWANSCVQINYTWHVNSHLLQNIFKPL